METINVKNIIERCEKGIEFINSNFTIVDIFEKVKKISIPYIDDKDGKLLNECQDYSLKIVDNKLDEIIFTFGEAWQLYEVKMNAFNFEITQQQGHSRSRVIIIVDTYKLKI